MRRSWIVPVALLGFSACAVGASTRTFAPANEPQGIEADLRLERGKTRIQGELLEVQDTALLVLRDDARVTVVPLRAIRFGSFHRRGTLIVGGRVRPNERERLRLVSRFPAGLTPELRARLLAAYGQTEIERVGP
jgi:hypothetical protein